MSATAQLDLTLDRADTDLVPKFCPYCGEKLTDPHTVDAPDAFAVFRQHRRQHHPWGPTVDPDDDPTLATNQYTGPGGEPAVLGSLYDITLAYTVEYRFRVAGRTQQDAERRAKDWAADATPADRYHVHTDRREVTAYTEADEELPDYLDPRVDDDAGDTDA